MATLVEQWERRGEERGIQQGFQLAFEKGFQVGFRQGLCEAIQMGLQIKLGEAGVTLMAQISGASLTNSLNVNGITADLTEADNYLGFRHFVRRAPDTRSRQSRGSGSHEFP